jgi:CRISPR-associated protein (TIGR03984 family)
MELFSYQKEGLSLQEAIQQPLAEGTLGLFYTPAQCQLGRWDNGEIRDARDKVLAIEQVFEARLFHPSLELRWLRDPSTDGLGNAVYLCENQRDNGWQQQQTLCDLSVQNNQYLLWGEYWKLDNLAKGWSCLAAARIGKLLVPVANLQKNQRVVLKTREYFGLPRDADGKLTLAGEHGNNVVVEERWLSLGLETK